MSSNLYKLAKIYELAAKQTENKDWEKAYNIKKIEYRKQANEIYLNLAKETPYDLHKKLLKVTQDGVIRFDSKKCENCEGLCADNIRVATVICIIGNNGKISLSYYSGGINLNTAYKKEIDFINKDDSIRGVILIYGMTPDIHIKNELKDYFLSQNITIESEIQAENGYYIFLFKDNTCITFSAEIEKDLMEFELKSSEDIWNLYLKEKESINQEKLKSILLKIYSKHSELTDLSRYCIDHPYKELRHSINMLNHLIQKDKLGNDFDLQYDCANKWTDLPTLLPEFEELLKIDTDNGDNYDKSIEKLSEKILNHQYDSPNLIFSDKKKSDEIRQYDLDIKRIKCHIKIHLNLYKKYVKNLSQEQEIYHEQIASIEKYGLLKRRKIPDSENLKDQPVIAVYEEKDDDIKQSEIEPLLTESKKTN